MESTQKEKELSVEEMDSIHRSNKKIKRNERIPHNIVDDGGIPMESMDEYRVEPILGST